MYAVYGMLRRRLEQTSDLDVFVSVVSFHEEIVGWNKYLARAKNSPSLVKVYSMFYHFVGVVQCAGVSDRSNGCWQFSRLGIDLVTNSETSCCTK